MRWHLSSYLDKNLGIFPGYKCNWEYLRSSIMTSQSTGKFKKIKRKLCICTVRVMSSKVWFLFQMLYACFFLKIMWAYLRCTAQLYFCLLVQYYQHRVFEQLSKFYNKLQSVNTVSIRSEIWKLNLLINLRFYWVFGNEGKIRGFEVCEVGCTL